MFIRYRQVCEMPFHQSSRNSTTIVGISKRYFVPYLPIELMEAFVRKLKLILLVPLAGTVMFVTGQSNDVVKAITNSGIFDISDLRHSNPNQFFKQVYLRDSTYTYHRNDDSTSATEWNLAERQIHLYNNQGQRIKTDVSAFSNNQWLKKQRRIFTFSEDNVLHLRQDLIWSDTANIWVNDLRTTYSYNHIGKEEEIVRHKWDKGSWVPSEMTSKSYTFNDLIENQIKYIWNSFHNEWEEESRKIFTYNSDELLIIEINQEWSDTLNGWINITQNAFTYDDEDNLVNSSHSYWDAANSRFIESTRTSLVYNELGQVAGSQMVSLNGNISNAIALQAAVYDSDGNLGNVLHSQWNPESQEWEVLTRLMHYYSRTYIGNLDGSSFSGINCLFANPYTIGDTWFCEAVKKDLYYTIHVFDLMGRPYFSGSFYGGSSFRIDRQIPSGFYTVVIRGGLDQHTEKVFIH